MALTSLPQSPPQVVRVALVDDDAFVLTALRACPAWTGWHC